MISLKPSSWLVKGVAVVVFIAALCYWSYDYGISSERVGWLEEKQRLNQVYLDSMERSNKSRVELQDQLTTLKKTSDDVREVLVIKKEEVEVEVIKYVKDNSNVCDLDDDWLHIYNNSINRKEVPTRSTLNGSLP